VKGSKEARAYGVQAVFSRLQVHAPVKDWSEMVLEEMEFFPYHRFRDITDSATQAIKYLRDAGLLNTDAESKAQEIEEQSEWLRRHKKGGVAERYFG
jgi:phage terminase large subunit-like protein